MGNSSLRPLMDALQEYVFMPIAYLLYSVAVLVFFWGLFEFMMSLQSDKSDKREEGKRHMLWGVMGFVIMLGVKGIINMIIGLFEINDLPVDLN